MVNNVKGNIFNHKDRILIHCISADLAMGAGLALQFRRRFLTIEKEIEKYTKRNDENFNKCVLIELESIRIANLITKRMYWQKPTYKTLERSFMSLKSQLKEGDKLAFPKFLACGLDKLDWGKVEKMIEEYFSDFDVLIIEKE